MMYEKELLEKIKSSSGWSKTARGFLLTFIFLLVLGIAIVWSEVRQSKTTYFIQQKDSLLITPIAGKISNVQAKVLFSSESIICYKQVNGSFQVYDINNDIWVTLNEHVISFN